MPLPDHVVSANVRVTIYTDSQYKFGVVRDFGQLWPQRGFMTSSGTPTYNGQRILNLLSSIQLPVDISVVKCAAPKTGNDFVTAGNRYADELAR